MHLFLYGTLQPGANLGFFEQNNLDQYMAAVGKASVSGDLLHVRDSQLDMDYPGLINAGTSTEKVHGTLFEVTHPEMVFPIMDTHEGYTAGLSTEDARRRNEYERVELDAALVDKQETLRATAYVLNRDSDEFNSGVVHVVGSVPSGDWLEYSKSFVP